VQEEIAGPGLLVESGSAAVPVAVALLALELGVEVMFETGPGLYRGDEPVAGLAVAEVTPRLAGVVKAV